MSIILYCPFYYIILYCSRQNLSTVEHEYCRTRSQQQQLTMCWAMCWATAYALVRILILLASLNALVRWLAFQNAASHCGHAWSLRCSCTAVRTSATTPPRAAAHMPLKMTRLPEHSVLRARVVSLGPLDFLDFLHHLAFGPAVNALPWMRDVIIHSSRV